MREWTEEQRLCQSALIHRVQPWHNGGVKTEEGKRITRYNALKHGMRSAEVTKLKKLFARCDRLLTEIH